MRVRHDPDRERSGLSDLTMRALGVVLLVAISAVASAQYPNRPIKLVVPYAPGGGTDVLGRLIALELTNTLGQPMVVENRGGGGSNIGGEVVAKSAPDGYTLLIQNSTFAINASVFPNLPFDTIADFSPVIMVASVPTMLAVNAAVPARNVFELINLLKAEPGKYTYASCGNGSPQQLAAELLKRMTGTEMTHVPYKGCAPALADVVGGQNPISFNTAANTLPHVKSGKLRALAVTSKDRFALAPEIPPIAEAANLPDFDVGQWFGVLAPAKTPNDAIAKLNSAIAQMLAKRPIQERMLAQGFAPTTGTPEAFAAVIRSDVERWGKLVRSIGIKPE